ncbi:corazonin [Arctopsyche grandis]|uniref:corazonin n=1 Tax=Arctopsyche grandis TaxID=121162 RepID=UPI00406D8B80
MNTYLVSLLVFATFMTLGFSTVTAQTFQYSRGWTNGKRNGMIGNGIYEVNSLDKLLSNPCELEKLRYALKIKPLNEKLMVQCDLLSMSSSDVDSEAPGLRLKRSASPFEARNFDNRQNLV